MTAVTRLRPEFVEFIPERLAPGTIYISKRYATASHLCCCGCGLETVTPLNSAKWRVIEHGDTISLTPSVGNWSFPCQSHYIIDRGRVVWAKSYSPRLVAAVQAEDQRDAELLARQQSDPLHGIKMSLREAWKSIRKGLGV